MLTAMDDDLDQAEGLDVGADDYLAKPFAYPVLLARLRALTRRGFGERPAVLTAAGLTLDPARRAVTRDGAEVELTSREVSVLEYLMRRTGQVVSKSELLEHCWTQPSTGTVQETCRPSRRALATAVWSVAIRAWVVRHRCEGICRVRLSGPTRPGGLALQATQLREGDLQVARVGDPRWSAPPGT
jgi:hypothetical protein